MCVALGVAPVMLWIFAGGVGALADLPDAIAASPDLFRQYASELSDLYDKVVRPRDDSAIGRGAAGLVSGVRLSWRVWREFPDVGGVGGVAQVSLLLFALRGPGDDVRERGPAARGPRVRRRPLVSHDPDRVSRRRPGYSKPIELKALSFLMLCRALMSRTVPDFERITSDCVVQPLVS